MTEAQLQALVMRTCEELGLVAFHVPDSRRVGARGWVDLVILGIGGALFVELKSEDGRRSQAQIEMARAIRVAGLQYRLWTPLDWRRDNINRDLRRLAEPF